MKNKSIKQILKYFYYKIPDYYRLGNSFKKKYDFLEKSQWYSEQEIKEFQLKKLKEIIEYSYKNVPYYTKLFNKINLKPEDIKDLEDIKKIPYLTKSIIKNNINDLVSKEYINKEKKLVATGGSTGMPLEFYIDFKKDKINEWAFITSMWSRIGYNVRKNERSVIIKGYKPKKGIAEYNANNLILSSYLISNYFIKEYIDRINKFNPKFIQAYPSSITLLCKYIKQNNLKLEVNNLKAIICPSEMLYDSQREIIEEVFGVRVYTFYGHTEHCCIGGECEESHYYHLNYEYGYTELLNNDNNVKNEDEIGELVATSFNNYVMPFIRYKTGDLAINTNKKCVCGRNYKIIKKLYGRSQEYFVKKNRELMTFMYSDVPLWCIKDKLVNYQYIQNEPGKIILNINSNDNIEDYLNEIRKEFNKYYGELDLEINQVDNIERTKRGKFKFLIQNLEF
ncbi:phenylacetate--CoA ligase family protein [Clostridium perfringens]|uniref:phenylacetate--CoA ligase family protein n=1 Tax=Clostridium perfringens TaxID=1502 RepID=UPI000F8CDBEC|nr:phenylacetate--CoA ligase family protein [Clostridium perfringens]RUR35225.1 phenylacetate--CoA ligase family protein [Clostridium perfringens]